MKVIHTLRSFSFRNIHDLEDNLNRYNEMFYSTFPVIYLFYITLVSHIHIDQMYSLYFIFPGPSTI